MDFDEEKSIFLADDDERIIAFYLTYNDDPNYRFVFEMDTLEEAATRVEQWFNNMEHVWSTYYRNNGAHTRS
jgi:hypothetical protein